jgi:hypothetical protein
MPTFSAEEQYLVSVMRGDVKDTSAFMWTYLLTGALIAGFAAYYENIWMMLSAFVVLCGVRIYEERWQLKWRPVTRSVILKYEAACAGVPEPQTSN